MADSEDTETPPKRTIETMIAEADATAATAREQLIEALKKAFDAEAAAANIKGWHEGFGKGWQSAAEYFKDKMDKQLEEARAAQSMLVPDRLQDIPSSQSSPQTPQSSNKVVLEFIKQNPGLRGVQIAQHFDKAFFRLPERTVRTALHRLRNKEIKIVDGRWYTLDAAPADPQPSLMEDDDAAS